MSSHERLRPLSADAADRDLVEYRSVCGLSVVAAIAGGLSALALLDPALWSVPVVGIGLSLAALRRLARNEELIGRRGAIAGLVLSLLFLSSASAWWFLERWQLRSQGLRVAEAYFELLRSGQPVLAHQLTTHADVRVPLDDEEAIWELYREDQFALVELDRYLESPVVRTLVALGPEAHIRHYGSDGSASGSSTRTFFEVFTVTFDSQEGRKTFFVRLSLERAPRHRTEGYGWRVTDIDGGVRPRAFEEPM